MDTDFSARLHKNRVVQGLIGKGALSKIDYNVYYDPSLDDIDSFSQNTIITSSLFPLNPICLSTALYFNQLIDEPPNMIEIAVERGKTIPRFQTLPFKFRSFSENYIKLGSCNYHLNNRALLKLMMLKRLSLIAFDSGRSLVKITSNR